MTGIGWLALAGAAQAWAGDCTVISGTAAWLADEVRQGVSVVLEGERIAGVGHSLPDLVLELDGKAQVKQATWKGQPCTFVQGAHTQTTAGFIEVASQLGLVEVDLERVTHGFNSGGDAIRASVYASDAYDPWSTLIPIQRVEGVTSTVTSPTGGFISGHAAHTQLAGETQESTIRQRGVAMVVQLGASPSIAGALARAGEVLDAARAVRRNPSGYMRGEIQPLTDGASLADLQALYPVLDRTLPVVVQADAAHELEALLRFQRAQGIRLIIHGAAEGWALADELAQTDVAVVVDPLVYGPGSFGQRRARADNAALLVAAGVPVILSTFSSHNARNLQQMAGNAVRGGMNPVDALASVTRVPAQVFGLEGGELKEGEVADVVVWSGDPLELSSHPVALFIGGRAIELTSRQTALLDAYRVLPGTPRGAP
jgi:hypothetical protein